MKDTRTNVAPITCKLSNLTVFTTDPDVEHPETIFRQDQSFQVRLTVEFGGSGAIALMPLCLPIKINVFAEPYGLGSKVELGSTLEKTSARVLTYTPTLVVATPATAGLICEEIYQLIAVLRVGATDWPALITGIIEGLAIQIYQ